MIDNIKPINLIKLINKWSGLISWEMILKCSLKKKYIFFISIYLLKYYIHNKIILTMNSRARCYCWILPILKEEMNLFNTISSINRSGKRTLPLIFWGQNCLTGKDTARKESPRIILLKNINTKILKILANYIQ